MNTFYVITDAHPNVEDTYYPINALARCETGFYINGVNDYSEADEFTLDEIQAIEQWMDLSDFEIVSIDSVNSKD